MSILVCYQYTFWPTFCFLLPLFPPVCFFFVFSLFSITFFFPLFIVFPLLSPFVGRYLPCLLLIVTCYSLRFMCLLFQIISVTDVVRGRRVRGARQDPDTLVRVFNRTLRTRVFHFNKKLLYLAVELVCVDIHYYKDNKIKIRIFGSKLRSRHPFLVWGQI